MGNWIKTVSGKPFDLTDPSPSMVDAEAIAWALSNLCRFTGHVRRFVSVAEHSVIASRVVPREDALAALLHDAPEAYIGDISRPLKQEIGDVIKVIEGKVEEAVADAFGLEPGFSKRPAVVEADLRLLVTEGQQVMGGTHGWGLDDVEPYDILIEGWTPLKARGEFTVRLMDLIDARKEGRGVA